MKRFVVSLVAVTATLALTASALAVPPGVKDKTTPGAQLFNVYDTTQDGIQVGTDTDIGNIQARANPNSQRRVIINTHLQGAVPSCTYTVELVGGNPGNNGGLDGFAHSGPIYVLGTLTTDAFGEGNAHFDFDPSTVSWVGDDGTPALDSQHWAHLDFENPACVLGFNVYGAAPDPTLGIPFTFWS